MTEQHQPFLLAKFCQKKKLINEESDMRQFGSFQTPKVGTKSKNKNCQISIVVKLSV
jgi:hypothetical protein